ncbi:polysaccharide deacetylase family protein [Pseudactinotalea sp.]|uniref:polysaccharide deacetylase family protein n=1 Tax=Pseudactinotalea sp. TaxID=1926260 RepID=UPI003B3AD3A7
MSQPYLLLTLDDRTVDHWFAHRGVLEEAGAYATFFVSRADQLTEDETTMLQVLQRDGHTIASHGLRHRDAPQYVAEHGLTAYLENEIEPSIAALAERGLGHRDFAFPFGRHDPTIDGALVASFSWLRATSPRHTDERATEVLVDLGANDCPRVLSARGIDVGRGGRANPDDSAALLTVLDEAADTGASVCLFAHDIAEWDQGLAQGHNFITPARLRQVLAAAQERGLSAVGCGVLPD